MNKALEFLESEHVSKVTHVLTYVALGVATIASWRTDGPDLKIYFLVLVGFFLFVFLTTIVCLIAFDIPIWIRHWINKDPEPATDWAAVLREKENERLKLGAAMLAERSEIVEERGENGEVTYRVLYENDPDRGWICAHCRCANTPGAQECIRCGSTTRRPPRRFTT